MRTNIVLNDQLLKEAQKYSRAASKKALIEEALLVFVKTKSWEHKTASYKDGLTAMEKQLSEIKLRESPQSILKESRERL